MAAIGTQTRTPHSTEVEALLTTFRELLFEKPFCSHGKDRSGQLHGFGYRMKDEAISYEMIQPNGPKVIHWIAIDIDRDRSTVIDAYDAGLPPNLVVIDPRSGKYHALYQLEKSIYTDGAQGRRHPAVRYLIAVTKALTRKLGGDPSFNQKLVKNPCHGKYEVASFRTKPWTLDELSRHLDLTEARLIQKESLGRNDTLFRSLGAYAKATKHRFRNYDLFRLALEHQASALNDSFIPPLPWREVRSTVNSVSRYVWDRWNGTGSRIVDRFAAQCDPRDPLRIRQQQGQSYAARVVTDRNMQKLRTALGDLISKGLRVTQQAIATVTGLCVRTVRVYWHKLIGRRGRFSNGNIDTSVNDSHDANCTYDEKTVNIGSDIISTEYPEHTGLPVCTSDDEGMELEEFFEYEAQLQAAIQRAEEERRERLRAEEQERRFPVGKRRTFTGTVAEFGSRRRFCGLGFDRTVLLRPICNGTGEVVLDECWFTLNKGFAALGLKVGMRIQFDARLEPRKWPMWRRSRPIYKLMYPTKVSIVLGHEVP